jgi:Bacterial alpha-L-rhamnosidase C-terminal domain
VELRRTGGRHEATDRVHQRRFPRAVGADEPHDLVVSDAKRHIVDREDPAESNRHPGDVERRHIVRDRSTHGSLEHRGRRHDTPYGLASSSWELVDGTLTVRAVVPPNTTARVQLPGRADEFEVGAGTHSWGVPFEPPPPALPTPQWGDQAPDGVS